MQRERGWGGFGTGGERDALAQHTAVNPENSWLKTLWVTVLCSDILETILKMKVQVKLANAINEQLTEERSSLVKLVAKQIDQIELESERIDR